VAVVDLATWMALSRNWSCIAALREYARIGHVGQRHVLVVAQLE